MKKTILLFALTFIVANFTFAGDPDKEKTRFRFAFFTDIHLNKGDNKCFEGLAMAIESAKLKHIDFILTGGDNVDIDVLEKDEKTAHELYQRYVEVISKAEIDYHVTVGNHDRYFACKKTNPLYNEGMFEKYISKSYYSFDNKGWHFIVLNTANSVVDEKQKQWLAEDLAKVDAETPIIVSVHVPFLSVYYPALEGEYRSNDTFSNFREIWDMFDEHKLKLVLQGHQHLYEEIKTLDVQFITGGAVSASWWGGSFHGTEEGYLIVECEGDEFTWEYVDYGWEVEQ
jgi:hypothetical protein